MSYESLLAEGRLRRRKTSHEDIHHLLRLAERDLADAAVPGLSADRRFLIAYEAALALATIPLFCAGYETHGSGHHWVTFQMLPRFMGDEYAELATYFESCRMKRNVGTYDRGGEISDSEADELLNEVADFKAKVERWLRANHPEFR
jgi:hypothetical protein